MCLKDMSCCINEICMEGTCEKHVIMNDFFPSFPHVGGKGKSVASCTTLAIILLTPSTQVGLILTAMFSVRKYFIILTCPICHNTPSSWLTTTEAHIAHCKIKTSENQFLKQTPISCD